MSAGQSYVHCASPYAIINTSILVSGYHRHFSIIQLIYHLILLIIFSSLNKNFQNFFFAPIDSNGTNNFDAQHHRCFTQTLASTDSTFNFHLCHLVFYYWWKYKKKISFAMWSKYLEYLRMWIMQSSAKCFGYLNHPSIIIIIMGHVLRF